MAMTNAERQKLHRQRAKERDRAGVTPADVLRAVKVIFDADREGVEAFGSFEAFLAKERKRGDGKLWREFLPRSIDPDDYPDGLTGEERAFLVKVAAVVQSVLYPPLD